MKFLAFALLILPLVAYSAEPFLLLDANAGYTDSGTIALLEKYLSPADYLGHRAVQKLPELNSFVQAEHQVEILPSLEHVSEIVQQGCGPRAAGVIYYQWGDPSITPAGEMEDPQGSVARAAAMIRTSGCHRFGFLPEGHFFGSTACSAKLDGSIYQKIDWSIVDYLDITSNWLLSDSCKGKSTVSDYVSFVQAVAGYIRARNPKIVLTAHFSFGYNQPALMVEAARALNGAVDGLLLAYPLSPVHEHVYSTPQNLQLVFSALRPR